MCDITYTERRGTDEQFGRRKDGRRYDKWRIKAFDYLLRKPRLDAKTDLRPNKGNSVKRKDRQLGKA
jgi:hypothetical protein